MKGIVQNRCKILIFLRKQEIFARKFAKKGEQ